MRVNINRVFPLYHLEFYREMLSIHYHSLILMKTLRQWIDKLIFSLGMTRGVFFQDKTVYYSHQPVIKKAINPSMCNSRLQMLVWLTMGYHFMTMTTLLDITRVLSVHWRKVWVFLPPEHWIVGSKSPISPLSPNPTSQSRSFIQLRLSFTNPCSYLILPLSTHRTSVWADWLWSSIHLGTW